MPWKARDAPRHTRKADTAGKRALWSDVANETLKRTGSEGRAIRAANAVVGRVKGDVKKVSGGRRGRR